MGGCSSGSVSRLRFLAGDDRGQRKAPIMKAVAGLFMCLALMAPDVANACRRSPSPAEIMGRRHAAVTIVRIDEVTSTPPSKPVDQWRATATRVSVVEGAEPPVSLILGHAEMPHCRERRPVPQPGEYWVAYIEAIGDSDAVVYNAWPIDWARSIDPRFSGAPAF